MGINPCNRSAPLNQIIPANFCKHAPIAKALSLFASKSENTNAKSEALNTILKHSNLKGLHFKPAKKALMEGITQLHANPDINNNIDTSKAAEICFKKVAEYGYPIGHFLIGEMHIQNADDQEKGMEYLIKAADKNHLYACLSLAEIYAYKAQSNRTYTTQAIEYYKKAGNLGSLDAYFQLAKIFQNRAGGSHFRKNANADYEKAIKYYKKAGNLGSSDAYFQLAKIFQNKATKNQSSENYEKAIKYYKKAGKLGSSDAYFQLAKLYANRNCNASAINYYDKASKLGCKKSSLVLGKSHLYGRLITEEKLDKTMHFSLEKNLDKAIHFLAKAGSLCSDLESQICSWKNSGSSSTEKYFYLAEIFRDNITLDTEPLLQKIYIRESIHYYEKAGELGCSEAYLRLSPIFFYGMGIEKSREKAIACLEKAKALGSSIASSRLKAIHAQEALMYNVEDIPFIDE